MRRKGVVATVVAAVMALTVGVVEHSNVATTGSFDPRAAYEIPATQDIQFRIAVAGTVKWGPAHELAGTVDALRSRLSPHVGDGFVLRAADDSTWSVKRTLDKTLSVLRDRLDVAAVGDAWLVRALDDGFTLRVKKFDLNPAMVIDTQGTLAVDIIVGTTVVRFPGIQSLGILVCKKISGTNVWSQHAYGNAADWGGTVELLDDVAAYQRSLVDKGYLPISQLLWRVSGHYNHIHDSGSPLMFGTPECAGG